MKGYLKREDDFNERRKNLNTLTDKELEEKFWSLAENIMEPIIEMSKKYTSPAIERSILLRMGFSSLEAKPLVDKVINHGLIGKGAGNIIYKVSKLKNITIREAGLGLLQDFYWEDVKKTLVG